MRARALMIAAVAIVALLATATASATSLPADSLGVNVRVWDVPGSNIQPSDLNIASAAGVGEVRDEANEGDNMDDVVQWLAQSHLRLYPVLGLPCPPSTLNCTFQTLIPVATAASEMAQYVTSFAQRYGPKGSFWAAHPSLPYEPVLDYEIGNEPNIRVIWVQDGTHLHWPDVTNLQGNAGDYAQVYEAARSALHAVDPNGVAVVGGLGDSAAFGVDVLSGETLLNALPRGQVDAVGYHPWVFDVSDNLLEPDTAALRTWMDANGFSNVPIQVNEVGACGSTVGTSNGQSCTPAQSSAQWGSALSSYTKWALCTPWVGVSNVQPFVWGGTPVTDTDIWLPLVSSSGSETPYGQTFLAQATALTKSGCPAVTAPKSAAPAELVTPAISGNLAAGSQLQGDPGSWSGTPAPTIYEQWLRCNLAGNGCSVIGGATSGTYTLQTADQGSTIRLLVIAANKAGGATATTDPTGEVYPPGTNHPVKQAKKVLKSVPPLRLRSMGLRIVRVRRHGRRLTITVRHARGSGSVTVIVVRRGRKHARRIRGRRRNATTTLFTTTLGTGRWTVTVTGKPAKGYAKPKAKRRRVRIAAPRTHKKTRRKTHARR